MLNMLCDSKREQNGIVKPKFLQDFRIPFLENRLPNIMCAKHRICGAKLSFPTHNIIC